MSGRKLYVGKSSWSRIRFGIFISNKFISI